MLLKWFIFGLTFSAILAVGKKRARIDDGDDDCFPDEFLISPMPTKPSVIGIDCP